MFMKSYLVLKEMKIMENQVTKLSHRDVNFNRLISRVLHTFLKVFGIKDANTLVKENQST